MIRIVAEAIPPPAGVDAAGSTNGIPNFMGDVKHMVQEFREWCNNDKSRKNFLNRNRQIDIMLESLKNVDDLWKSNKPQDKAAFNAAVGSMLTQSAELTNLVTNGNNTPTDGKTETGHWDVKPNGVVSEEMLVNLFYMNHVPYNVIVGALDILYRNQSIPGAKNLCEKLQRLASLGSKPKKQMASERAGTSKDPSVRTARDSIKSLTSATPLDPQQAIDIFKKYKQDTNYDKLRTDDEKLRVLYNLLFDLSKKPEQKAMRDLLYNEIRNLGGGFRLTRKNCGVLNVSTVKKDISAGENGQQLWNTLMSGYSAYGSRYNNVGPLERFLSLLLGSSEFPSSKGDMGDGDVMVGNKVVEVKYISNGGLDAMPTVGNSIGAVIFFALDGDTILTRKKAEEADIIGYIIVQNQSQVLALFTQNDPKDFEDIKDLWSNRDK